MRLNEFLDKIKTPVTQEEQQGDDNGNYAR